MFSALFIFSTFIKIFVPVLKLKKSTFSVLRLVYERDFSKFERSGGQKVQQTDSNPVYKGFSGRRTRFF